MADDDNPTGLPFGMSHQTFIRLMWIFAALSFLLAIVSLAGEVLGWWNDLGEIGATAGSITSVLFTMGGVYYGAGQAQVDRVHDAVVENGDKLETLETLDDIQFELDRQTGVLGQIRDRL